MCVHAKRSHYNTWLLITKLCLFNSWFLHIYSQFDKNWNTWVSFHKLHYFEIIRNQTPQNCEKSLHSINHYTRPQVFCILFLSKIIISPDISRRYNYTQHCWDGSWLCLWLFLSWRKGIFIEWRFDSFFINRKTLINDKSKWKCSSQFLRRKAWHL